MDIFQILTILTCASSIATMFLVIMAALPHVKNGMAVIRDAVLWLAFVCVVALAGWLGWQRVVGRGPTVPPSRTEGSAFIRTSATSLAPVPSASASDPFFQEP
jgi:hypothetical protein